MADDVHNLPASELERSGAGCPLLEGDSEAWIVCCSSRFFPLARRIAGDDGLAEDVLQISWIKILQAINHARFNGPKACPWVHRVVTNTARDVRYQQARRSEVFLREEAASNPSSEALVQEKELRALLREMIQLLPDTYRRVLEMRLYQGFSNQEIAASLHISRSSVTTRLNRAVNLLKRRLEART